MVSAPVLNDPRLRFDDVEHRYFLDDHELISVTTALKEAGMVDTRNWTEEARVRGAYLHRAIHLYATGELEAGTIDPGLEPYFVAFRTFLDETRVTFEYVEQRVCDPVAGYAGTLDAIVCWPDDVRGLTRRVLIDWKSGWFPPMAGPQTAAYLRCARTWYPTGTFISRAGLHLQGNGTYRTFPFTDIVQDEHDFMAALRVAQFRRRHGITE